MPVLKDSCHIIKRGLLNSFLQFFKTIAGMEKSGEEEFGLISSIALIISPVVRVISLSEAKGLDGLGICLTRHAGLLKDEQNWFRILQRKYI